MWIFGYINPLGIMYIHFGSFPNFLYRKSNDSIGILLLIHFIQSSVLCANLWDNDFPAEKTDICNIAIVGRAESSKLETVSNFSPEIISKFFDTSILYQYHLEVYGW